MPHLRNLNRKQSIGGNLRRAVNALACLLVGLQWRTAPAPVAPVYQTDIGQQTTVILQDQSEVHLGGDTSVRLNDSSQFRTVHLQRGEIFARVHHDSDRPFEVVVNHLIALDLGTAYDISTHESTSNVAVTDGQVRLFQRDDWGRQIDPITVESGGYRRVPVILGPGDVARVEQLEDGTVIVTRSPRSIEGAREHTEWLGGSMIASTRRLDEIVWAFNRYSHTPIVIDDPEVGAMLFTVGFRLDNINGLIESLKLRYDVEIVKGTGGQPLSYHLKGVATDGGKKPRPR